MPRMLAMVAAVVGALVGAAALPLAPAPARAQTTAALPLPPPAQARPTVLDSRLGIHPDKTRFVLELSESVPFSVSVLTNPYRVVVDLPELAWPNGGAVMAGKGTAGKGLIARYRYEARDTGAPRLVFETTGPVRVLEAFTLPARDGFNPRFVIDIERASAAQVAQVVARAAASAPPVPKAEASRPAARPNVVPVAAPMAPPAPPKAAPMPEKPLVVLDPGHGGVDPGAVGVGGVYEKDITLAMARELKRQLEASGRYRVRMTRDKDVFVRLRDRVAIARESNADLFLSLHADSIGSSNMRGLSIYTLSDKASDREAEMLAAKENRADAIAGLDLSAENDLVASILIDLAQRDTKNHSKRFANMALEHLGRDIKLIPSKPHRQAGFAVLTAPDLPSALVEMGYLSSPQDANLLNTPGHREKLARAMVRGVDAYFKWLSAARGS